jgi:hypothetical protein
MHLAPNRAFWSKFRVGFQALRNILRALADWNAPTPMQLTRYQKGTGMDATPAILVRGGNLLRELADPLVGPNKIAS